ncbi:MAG: PQQ-dependent sugar dehydrogenase [Gemmatimonadetes bacterium]|nr:PQQ-dependent sugar dehydrogenase [Gemmatimonadota bacterium]
MNRIGRLGLPLLLAVGGSVPLTTVSNRGSRAPDITDTPAARLTVETVASGLDTPWDLAWGPDGVIWVTERPGTISRVDPSTGQVTRVGRIDVVEVSESGLMGIAFHPDFANQPYVYVAHSYGSRRNIRNRLVRMRFDGARLGAPQVLVDNIPGNRNHNGSRLAIGADRLLYMTTGDAGRAARAQDRGDVAGKILRVTLEGRPAPENPFGTLVYSYGHRNPQGIVFHPVTGALYIAEHGPRDNDEVNRVKKGGNYGWPAVHGFCDGDTRGEEAFCRSNDVVEPVTAWTPTVGVSGADFYDGTLIPGWNGSLLVTSLRGQALYRLTLSADGSTATEREVLFRGEYGRLRDVLVGPRGEVYLATSNRDGRGNPARDDDRILRILP